MMAFWDRVSYMIQILAACLAFLIPARKKAHSRFVLPVVFICMVLLSLCLNLYYSVPENGFPPLIYWMFYICAAVFFVWSGLAGTWVQALYCAACGCTMQHIAFDLYYIYILLFYEKRVVSLLIYIAAYLFFYYLFVRKLPERGVYVVSRQTLFPVLTIFLLVWIMSVAETSTLPGFQAETGQRILYRIIDGLCCFYVLWIQVSQKERMSLVREMEGVNAIWRQQKRQFEVTSEAIESINRKCHDLKHQIRRLKESTDENDKENFLHEIEKDIMIYDTAINTGNKALDTVLMEKGFFCMNHAIQWSCMADAEKLNCMKDEDIYSIFGNALDNAITAVLAIDEEEKRVIDVRIIHQNNVVVVQIQNYYHGGLNFENGLPLTTKKNRRDHGYGMKSIRYTAEKYNGTITVQVKNHIFMLQILIPLEGMRESNSNE